MSEAQKQYADLITELAITNPKTALLLRMAQEHREVKLRQYLNGVRFSGFEELLEHLDVVHEKFSNQSELTKVSFLLKRSKGEFIIALEALLSGYHTVAHDAMRAVMEIEFLFRDFSLDTTRIDEWLNADAKTLHEKFSPGILRKRFANHVGKPPRDLGEATDYKGHSMFLHVGPKQNPFGIADLTKNSNTFTVDSCFWEIFEHARRLLIAFHNLADVVDVGILSEYNPKNLERLAKAWVRTQEMQQIWQQLIGYEIEESSSDNNA